MVRASSLAEEHFAVALCSGSVFSFILFVLICTWWRRSKTQKNGYSDMKKSHRQIERENERKSLRKLSSSFSTTSFSSFSSNLSLPEIFHKPIFSVDTASKHSLDVEDMKTLKKEKFKLDVKFYANEWYLEVNISRVYRHCFRQAVCNNASIYIVASIQYSDMCDLSYMESEQFPYGDCFDVSFRFQLPTEAIPTLRTKETDTNDPESVFLLKVNKYINDNTSKHRFVNESVYSMNYKNTGEDIPIQISLTEIPQCEDGIGEILFTLCYLPTSGRLTFVACNAQGICEEVNTPFLTFVDVSLITYGKKMHGQQTTRTKLSSNPVYDDALVFYLPLECIRDTHILVAVMKTDVQDNRQVMTLGKVTVGLVGQISATNTGWKHWEAMLATPRRPVAQWHCLS